MTPRELGFLLLASSLGDPLRKPLTVPQLRDLSARVKELPFPTDERELEEADLVSIGCSRASAQHILRLLSDQDLLKGYLRRGMQQDCYPITRVSPGYPQCLRRLLGSTSPAVLWAKGDPVFLTYPAIAAVGSRELRPENLSFAHEIGKQAALQGFVLVSGNARGADRAAQECCLAHGGKVICVVADALQKYPLKRNVLYLSESGFDLAFSAQRALSRNHIIHCLGQKVFVAQCSLQKGGTWNGSVSNLQHNRRPVFCFDDGSPAIRELVQMGAVPIYKGALQDLVALQSNFLNFMDQ